MTSHVTRNLTRNEQRVLDLCKRFPNAVSCGGDGPLSEYEVAERLLYAEEVETLLVAEFGEGHRYTLLGGLASLMPEEDVVEAARLYPHDEVEAEKFLWRRFTEIRRAQGAPPEPSQRVGTDHAKERRRRAQAKASRRANRRR